MSQNQHFRDLSTHSLLKSVPPPSQLSALGSRFLCCLRHSVGPPHRFACSSSPSPITSLPCSAFSVDTDFSQVKPGGVPVGDTAFCDCELTISLA